MSKHNVFNLGELGVDVVKSRLHIKDGAWRSLQNGEFNPETAQGAVKKRGSLVALNSSALAGAVQGLTNVPLPLDPDVFMLLAMNNSETETFKESEDGAAFVDIASATMPRYLMDPNDLLTSWDLIVCPVAFYKRAFYYPGDNYIKYNDTGFTNPPLVVYTPDEAAFELIRVPPNPTDPLGAAVSIVAMTTVNGLIYFATADSGGVAPNLKGRVFSFDPSNGVLTEVGNRFGDDTGENTHGFPSCFASYQGYLWVGTYGSSGNNIGRIYKVIAGSDTEWTVDLTLALHNGYVHTLAVYKGKLYAGSDADSAGTAIVIERNPATGIWTTSFTSPTSNISRFTGLIVFDGNLYVNWRHHAGANLIKKFDGTTWTTDLDVAGTFADRPSGYPFVFKGALYWPFASASIQTGTDGFLLKRDTLGNWTRPLNAVGLRGALGKFSPDAA